MQDSLSLKSKSIIVLSTVLVLQAVIFYSLSGGENVPLARPLTDLPSQLGSWSMMAEGVIEQEVQDVLKADDLLTRSYQEPSGRGANLFVAFFKSQRTGQAPHSPKNCLPGSGWVPAIDDKIPIDVPGSSTPMLVNRYLVQKGDSKSIVLYWYQSRDRVVASEYWAKFYVIADALRYNRTDTALVRIVVPVTNNDIDSATQSATEFAQTVFMPLRQQLPG
jgi:EpsI family protein